MLPIFKDDPQLGSHESQIMHRINAFRGRKEQFRTNEGGIDDFAEGYKTFGFQRHEAEQKWTFTEWLPEAREVFLIGEFNNWENSHPLKPGEFGRWSIDLPDKRNGKWLVPHRSQVRLRIQTGSGTVERVPAWCKLAWQNPDVNVYNGVMWEPPPSERYVMRHARPPRPASLKIYEAHLGIAGTEERIHSYLDFKEVLPRIKRLGYNALQIMAVAEHAQHNSYGYQVTSFFAPSSRFGSPEELKELVDAAHAHGLTILLDLVHSHCSSNQIDGIAAMDGTSHCYTHGGHKGKQEQWHASLFDYGKYEVLRFLLSNIRWWIEEYGFDGFRFGGVTSMLYYSHGIGKHYGHDYHQYFGGDADLESATYLMLANYLVKRLLPRSGVTIAEDFSGMPTLCRSVDDGGFGFDYCLSVHLPGMWSKLLSEPDETWSVSRIVKALTKPQKFKEPSIAYAECHDQAKAGSRSLAQCLMGAEMFAHMSISGPESKVIDRGLALHKMIRLVCLGMGGEGYLNFMGNEFAHPDFVDLPSHANGWSLQNAIRRFDLPESEDLKYKFFEAFDEAMVALENRFQFMTSSSFCSRKDDSDKVLVFEKGDCLFVFNFHPTQTFTEYRVGHSWNEGLRLVLDSDDACFGGGDRLRSSYEHSMPPLDGWDSRRYSSSLLVPSRTVQVLVRESLLEGAVTVLLEDTPTSAWPFATGDLLLAPLVDGELGQAMNFKVVENRLAVQLPGPSAFQVYWEVQKGRVSRGAPAKVRLPFALETYRVYFPGSYILDCMGNLKVEAAREGDGVPPGCKDAPQCRSRPLYVRAKSINYLAPSEMPTEPQGEAQNLPELIAVTTQRLSRHEEAYEDTEAVAEQAPEDEPQEAFETQQADVKEEEEEVVGQAEREEASAAWDLDLDGEEGHACHAHVERSMCDDEERALEELIQHRHPDVERSMPDDEERALEELILHRHPDEHEPQEESQEEPQEEPVEEEVMEEELVEEGVEEEAMEQEAMEEELLEEEAMEEELLEEEAMEEELVEEENMEEELVEEEAMEEEAMEEELLEDEATLKVSQESTEDTQVPSLREASPDVKVSLAAPRQRRRSRKARNAASKVEQRRRSKKDFKPPELSESDLAWLEGPRHVPLQQTSDSSTKSEAQVKQTSMKVAYDFLAMIPTQDALVPQAQQEEAVQVAQEAPIRLGLRKGSISLLPAGPQDIEEAHRVLEKQASTGVVQRKGSISLLPESSKEAAAEAEKDSSPLLPESSKASQDGSRSQSSRRRRRSRKERSHPDRPRARSRKDEEEIQAQAARIRALEEQAAAAQAERLRVLAGEHAAAKQAAKIQALREEQALRRKALEEAQAARMALEAEEAARRKEWEEKEARRQEQEEKAKLRANSVPKKEPQRASIPQRAVIPQPLKERASIPRAATPPAPQAWAATPPASMSRAVTPPPQVKVEQKVSQATLHEPVPVVPVVPVVPAVQVEVSSVPCKARPVAQPKFARGVPQARPKAALEPKLAMRQAMQAPRLEEEPRMPGYPAQASLSLDLHVKHHEKDLSGWHKMEAEHTDLPHDASSISLADSEGLAEKDRHGHITPTSGGTSGTQTPKTKAISEISDSGDGMERVFSLAALDSLLQDPEKKTELRHQLELELEDREPKYRSHHLGRPVVVVSSEVNPWSKTGGLAMVAGSYGYEFAMRGHRTMVVCPRYQAYEGAQYLGYAKIWLDGREHEVQFFHLYQDLGDGNGTDFVFVGHQCFMRGGLYCDPTTGKEFPDNLFRFSLLTVAALEAPLVLNIRGSTYGQDVLFIANDWQTGLLPVYHLYKYRRNNTYRNSRTVFVIHNIGYQGKYRISKFPVDSYLGLPPEAIDFLQGEDLNLGSDCMNLLSAAILASDRVLTVSPNYAAEIQSPEGGQGLHEILQEKGRQNRMAGILNGIADEWNPRTDPYIPRNYTWRTFEEGKALCKRELQRSLGLHEDPGAALIGFCGRLCYQKGVQLLTEMIPWLLNYEPSGVLGRVQVILMGKGEDMYANQLMQAEGCNKGRVCGYVGFDPKIEHRMLAGCDFLLMPSQYEPCGLPQMYAQAYGTVPVVHETGGLKDSVLGLWDEQRDRDTATGFLFCGFDENHLKERMYQALEVFHKKRDLFKQMQLNGLRSNFYWPQAIDEYERQLDWTLDSDAAAS